MGADGDCVRRCGLSAGCGVVRALGLYVFCRSHAEKVQCEKECR